MTQAALQLGRDRDDKQEAEQIPASIVRQDVNKCKLQAASGLASAESGEMKTGLESPCVVQAP